MSKQREMIESPWFWLIVLALAAMVYFYMSDDAQGQVKHKVKKDSVAVKMDTTVSRIAYIQALRGRIDQIQQQANLQIVVLQNIITEYEGMTADSITFKKPEFR